MCACKVRSHLSAAAARRDPDAPLYTESRRRPLQAIMKVVGNMKVSCEQACLQAAERWCIESTLGPPTLCAAAACCLLITSCNWCRVPSYLSSDEGPLALPGEAPVAACLRS